LRIRVTGAAGGNVSTFEVVTPGVWSGATRPTTTVGATFTQVVDGTDHNAADLSFTFNNDWGVSAVTKATDGDYTAFTSGAKATTVTPSGGTGATLTITSVLESVDVLTPGRGYTATSDAAITFSGGTGASATAVLTNSYQNGLRVNAFVVGGSSAVLGDIMKQEASRRYLVKTAEGQSQCKLVASDTPAEGQMNLIATDWTSASYYVTKLTAHKATVVNRYNTSTAIYTTGQVAPWTIGNTTGTYITLSNV
jgi:hypothetical protein